MNARLHGLLLILGGIGGALGVLGLMIVLGMLLSSATGSNIIPVAVYPAALPLAFAFAGWMELLTGMRLKQLSERFDTANQWTKFGLGLVVVVAVILFIALMIWLGIRVNGWLDIF